MGGAAAGAGLRQRDDLLAAAARLAARRGVAPAAPDPAQPAGAGGPHRLESGQRRQRDRPRQGAKRGAPGTRHVGPNPTDRAKPGTKHHLVADRNGIPLTIRQTAANVNEGTLLIHLLDSIEPIRRPRGRPRRRPAKLHADKAYASRATRAALRRRHVAPRIARKGIESRTRLGRYRWVVERDFAWLYRSRHLLVRYDRDDQIHEAFLHLACALICWHVIERLGA